MNGSQGLSMKIAVVLLGVSTTGCTLIGSPELVRPASTADGFASETPQPEPPRSDPPIETGRSCRRSSRDAAAEASQPQQQIDSRPPHGPIEAVGEPGGTHGGGI